MISYYLVIYYLLSIICYNIKKKDITQFTLLSILLTSIKKLIF